MITLNSGPLHKSISTEKDIKNAHKLCNRTSSLYNQINTFFKCKHQIDQLSCNINFFLSHQIAEIFNCKHQIDQLSNYGKTSWIVLPEKKIDISKTIHQLDDLVSLVKRFLKRRPENGVFKLAAQTTLLFSNTIKATFELSKTIISPLNDQNQQDVFLLPKSGIVIKSMSDRYTEEEDSVSQLLMFDVPSVIPPYKIFKGLSAKRLCEKLEIKNPEVDPEMPSEYVFFHDELASSNKHLVLLKFFEKKIEKTYREIVKKVSHRSLSGIPRIRLTQLQTESKQKLFYDRISNPFFLIKTSRKVKEILNKYKKNCWTYSLGDIHSVNLSFRDLIYEVSKLKCKNRIKQQTLHPVISFKGPEDEPAPSAEEISFILKNYEWEVHFPEVYFSDNDDYSISSHPFGYPISCSAFEKVSIKSFEYHMFTLANLYTQRKAIEAIFHDFDYQSQLAILLALKYQMIDLHPGNVGIVMKLTEEQEYLRKLQFYVNLKNVKNSSTISRSFEEIQCLFLNGTIGENTLISYCNEKETECNKQEKVLKNIPYMLKAINCEKRCVLFDGDLCLGESNHFYIIIKEYGQHEFYIPIKNPLLLIRNKYEECPQDLLNELLKENQKVTSWIRRLDAPLRMRLDLEAQDRIDNILFPILSRQEYNLSKYLLDDSEATKANCRNLFAKDFAGMNEEGFEKILEIICDQIPWIKSKMDSFQTALLELKNIHNIKEEILRIKISISNLQNYIKNITKKIVALKEQSKNDAKIPSLEKRISVKQAEIERFENKREKLLFLLEQPQEKFEFLRKIAKQLFPRLTFNQYQALLERENNLKSYLELYEKIQKINPDNHVEFLQILQLLIEHPVCSFLQKYKYKSYLTSRAPIPNVVVQDLYETIIDAFAPTYFNIMKSMYPQLGDVHDLVIELNKRNQDYDIKLFIHHDVALMVRKGISIFPYESPAYLLCDHLRNEMEKHNTYVLISYLRN